MTDQITETITAAVETGATGNDQAKNAERTFTQAELDQIVKERVERVKRQVADAEAKARAAAEADAAAKNGEWEKLAKAREQELAETKAALKARELLDLKRAIAAKVGIPAALADRLQGEDEASIEADAKALLETLPKQPPATPGIRPVNPGENGGTGETDAARRKRLGLA